MRKNTKKAVCILFAVLLLVCSFPISAFAVDPVSGAVIANSFAQAITAYGASHGVSMTFDGIDSGNTAQIGETVHELWKRFRAGQQTADDYDTIAAAVFPGLYNKVIKAGGTAVVGMSIAQEYMSDIDGFWNWLLSGPAEMVKVDNAYQWNVTDGSVVTPTVGKYSDSIGFQPIHYSADPPADAASWAACEPTMYANTNDLRRFYIVGEKPIYNVLVGNNNVLCQIAPLSFSGTRAGTMSYYPNQRTYSVYSSYVNNANTESTTGYKYVNSSLGLWSYIYPLPHYASVKDACAAIYGVRNGVDPSVVVAPYVGDAVARPVPLPDVGDPDYGPVPWTGDLDVPWNDTLFGDGTGTLTDAQRGAITEELDGVIEGDGTLILAGDQTAPGPDEDEDDPPSDDPDDYGVIGLENIFPFCIPFDIYNFLSALAATPTAPHFTATLQLPEAVGGAQTIELDFDNPTFNQLAQLLRLLELLAFIVGLALLTRSMFIRG